MSVLQQMEGKWKWVALGAVGFGLILVRRRMAGGKCRSQRLMTEKTIVITGANTGIGKATAIELAKREARVILACRDVSKAEQAVKDIRAVTSKGELIVRRLDLASFTSIREFVTETSKKEMHVDVLINNAAVYHPPESKTQDGLELQMGLNHFGHFLLTNLLLDRISASVPSRIVIVSSGLHQYGHIDFDNLNSEHSYDKAAAYNNSKLANNLFARELHRRLKGTGVSVYCLRPGMVRSDLGRHVQYPLLIRWLAAPLAWLLVKNTYEGCQTVVHCAVNEELEGVSGEFYADCKSEDWSAVSKDDKLAKQLWDVSEKMVKLEAS